MGRMMEKILRRYGREVQIRGKSEPIFGFFQPVTGRGEGTVRIGASPLGVEQTKQFVLIGPAEPALVLEDVLTVDGRQYLVRRAEPVYGVDGPVYQWAMCEAKGDLDLWGMDTSGYPL